IRGYLFVLGAATLWGTLGLFYTGLNHRYLVSPQAIAFFRACIALLILLLVLGCFRRDQLRIHPRDLPLLMAQGVLGIAAFYLVYASAVIVAGMSVAVVLMYTAPVWVTLFAWRFLHEGLDRYKIIALIGAMLGAALVAQVNQLEKLNWPGVMLGLASGICYACYSILNKYALRTYSPWTVLTWALIFSLPVLAGVQDRHEIWQVLTTPGALLWLVVMGLGPTLGAGLLYAAGLARLPASIASIIVAFEPVVASVLAFSILGERLSLGQIVGGVITVTSIALLGGHDLITRSNK
ncbi:MAG: DMT family transporter, partial [Anaerolineae bacterium]